MMMKPSSSSKLTLRKPSNSGFLEYNPMLGNARLLKPLRQTFNDFKNAKSSSNLIMAINPNDDDEVIH